MSRTTRWRGRRCRYGPVSPNGVIAHTTVVVRPRDRARLLVEAGERCARRGRHHHDVGAGAGAWVREARRRRWRRAPCCGARRGSRRRPGSTRPPLPRRGGAASGAAGRRWAARGARRHRGRRAAWRRRRRSARQVEHPGSREEAAATGFARRHRQPSGRLLYVLRNAERWAPARSGSIAQCRSTTRSSWRASPGTPSTTTPGSISAAGSSTGSW